MADNFTLPNNSGTRKAATDEVTYSGEAADCQLVRPVLVTGAVPVDHSYPTVDALRYLTPGGNPIDNGAVLVYLAEDYNATVPRRSVQYVVARTTTRADGRWVSPLMLDPGSYVVVMYKQGAYPATTVAVTVS